MIDLLTDILARLILLLQAPLSDQLMLWTAAPLVIATLFMTLYFGKYKQEELGWNTAFGNTMVFLFISINMIHFMYNSSDTSWDTLMSNNLFLTTTTALFGGAIILMAVTYYHLLPKKVAFFLFSAPPVNVSVYVIMTIIYTGVPADIVTLGAAILLFVIIFILLRLLQMVEHMASNPEGLSLQQETKEINLMKKLKEKNTKLAEKKHKELGGEKPKEETKKEPTEEKQQETKFNEEIQEEPTEEKQQEIPEVKIE
ncbi:MAG: hypothetical protein ABID61_04830 [Candidatus Micrarchaeota archaeon]